MRHTWSLAELTRCTVLIVAADKRLDFELELVVDVGLAAWLQAERQTAKKRERDTQRAYLDFLCESGSTVECREYHIGKDEGRSGTRMSAGC